MKFSFNLKNKSANFEADVEGVVKKKLEYKAKTKNDKTSYQIKQEEKRKTLEVKQEKKTRYQIKQEEKRKNKELEHKHQMKYLKILLALLGVLIIICIVASIFKI